MEGRGVLQSKSVLLVLFISEFRNLSKIHLNHKIVANLKTRILNKFKSDISKKILHNILFRTPPIFPNLSYVNTTYHSHKTYSQILIIIKCTKYEWNIYLNEHYVDRIVTDFVMMMCLHRILITSLLLNTY